MSTSFSEFMLEMEQEARAAGPEVAAAFQESQQRHWIGRLLLERRRERGLTQAKLAAISGVDQGDISKIEHAEANPTLETLTALTTALGCTLALQPIPDETRALLQTTHQQGRPNRSGGSQQRRRKLEPGAVGNAALRVPSSAGLGTVTQEGATGASPRRKTSTPAKKPDTPPSNQ